DALAFHLRSYGCVNVEPVKCRSAAEHPAFSMRLVEVEKDGPVRLELVKLDGQAVTPGAPMKLDAACESIEQFLFGVEEYTARKKDTSSHLEAQGVAARTVEQALALGISQGWLAHPEGENGKPQRGVYQLVRNRKPQTAYKNNSGGGCVAAADSLDSYAPQ